MFEDELHQLAQNHLLRRLRTIDSPSGPMISMGNREIALFASNNYLGLANHPGVKAAAREAIDQFGVGAGASRLVCGTLSPHQQLEEALAEFKGTPAALAFSSGYETNLGVIPSLVKRHGIIFADRRCHASLINGCGLSEATTRIFQHNDMEQLRKLLTRRSGNPPTLIVTEGVFSMDGDLAPLPDLITLAQEFEALLYVDDAHGTGVMGPTGRGTFEHFGIEPNTFIHMGTLSKALGVSGGFIAGDDRLKEYLINTAKTLIFTTAPPPAMAAAALAALTILQHDPDRRTRLWDNREYLFQQLKDLGFHLPQTQSPILPIILHDPGLAVEMSHQLLQQGIFIPAIRPPTVPKDTSRLRITVTADHTHPQLDTLVSTIRQVGETLHVL